MFINEKVLRYLFLFLLLTFGIDIVFMGSGAAWADYFGFPFRKVIIFLIAFYCLFLWVKNSWWTSKELIAVGSLFILLFFWNSVAAIQGVPIENSFKDSAALFTLLFAPAIGCFLLKKNIYEKVRQKLFVMTLILAMVHIALSIWGNYFPNSSDLAVKLMIKILDPVHDTDDYSSDLHIRPTSESFRVYWTSSLFLLVGLYFALQKMIEKGEVLNIITVMVLLVAIYCTMTRGLYGAALFLFIAIVFSRIAPSNIRSSPLFLIFGFCLLLMTFPLIALSEPSIIASLGLAHEGGGDDLRYEQTFFLLSDFFDNWFFGKGFGASCGGIIRSVLFPWSYEMSLMAYYMKVGILGMFISVITFFLYMRTTRIVRLNKKIKTNFFMLCGLLAGIVFASNTNPYLFSLNGFGFLLFVYTEMRWLSGSDAHQLHYQQRIKYEQ